MIYVKDIIPGTIIQFNKSYYKSTCKFYYNCFQAICSREWPFKEYNRVVVFDSCLILELGKIIYKPDKNSMEIFIFRETEFKEW